MFLNQDVKFTVAEMGGSRHHPLVILLRWMGKSGLSLTAVAVGVVVAAGGLSGCRRSETANTKPTHSTRGTAPWFQDVTARSGLAFVHDSGATGAYFMPESIGSGAALFDFDNDGRLDVYLVHCVPPDSRSKNRLFHQEADGRFLDVSEGSGLDVSGYGMGAIAGDVTNDGLPDVVITEYGRVRLFLNQGGGKFVEATAASGIDNPRWATAASFFDYDRDGWLDLVVGNYVDYTPTQKCHDTRGAPEYCGPQGMSGTASRLFRNRGGASGARFEDVSVLSGLTSKVGPALGIFCADFNGDRWPDIFVADDGQPNRLFVNQQNGTFVEEAVPRGLAYNAMGASAANMGVAVGDIDADGLFDLFVTHLDREQHILWKQGPRGSFQEVTAQAGLVNPAWRGTGFGAVLADFDLDGSPDLALANGAIRREPLAGPVLAGMNPFWAPYAQRNQLFANTGRGMFKDLSLANPDFCGTAGVGRGLACGDLDNDGALDLLVTCAGGPARILHNIAPKHGHWLVVRAIDPTCGGRDAYGAEVIVEAGQHHWWRLVQPASSFLVSNDPRVHFGLGDAASYQSILVIWPDGRQESFSGGSADRRLEIRKGTGMGGPP